MALKLQHFLCQRCDCQKDLYVNEEDYEYRVLCDCGEVMFNSERHPHDCLCSGCLRKIQELLER